MSRPIHTHYQNTCTELIVIQMNYAIYFVLQYNVILSSCLLYRCESHLVGIPLVNNPMINPHVETECQIPSKMLSESAQRTISLPVSC